MQKTSSLLPWDKIVTTQVIRFSSNLISVLVHPALGIICSIFESEICPECEFTAPSVEPENLLPRTECSQFQEHTDGNAGSHWNTISET